MASRLYPLNNNKSFAFPPTPNNNLLLSGEKILDATLISQNSSGSRFISIPAGTYNVYSTSNISLSIGNGIELTKTYSIPANKLTPINISSTESEVNNIEVSTSNNIASINFNAVMPVAQSAWGKIAYGNGAFVALSRQNGSTRAAYSTDGITWSLRTVTASSTYTELRFINDSFWALSNVGGVYVSTNGTTWTARATTGSGVTSPAYLNYANGRYILGGTGTAVGFSTNGITWTTNTANIQVLSPIYVNKKYYGLTADTTSAFAYSTDAITWTPVTPGFSNPLNVNTSVAYGMGRFVVIATTSAWSSTDGITWASTTLPAGLTYTHCAYGNNLFVASPNTSAGALTTCAYSTDGLVWNTLTMPLSGVTGWGVVSYARNTFFIPLNTNTTNIVSIKGADLTAPISFAMYNGSGGTY